MTDEATQQFPDPQTLTSAERINYLTEARRKVLDIEAGKMKPEEMSEAEHRFAIELLQAERKESTQRRSAKRTAAAAPAPSLDDLL